MRRIARAGLVALGVSLGALLVGCAVVNVYVSFPEEKIKEAAVDIESMVEGGAPVKPLPKTPTTPKKSSLLDNILFSPIYAQAIPQLKITPEIQEAVTRRKDRFSKIRFYKDAGLIGENNQGFIEARFDGQDVVAATKKDVESLVKDESRDREYIYKELVKQNNMAPEELANIKSAFAGVQRNKAKSGDWIQTETGEWKKKD